MPFLCLVPTQTYPLCNQGKVKHSALFIADVNASYARSRTLYRSAALMRTAHASNAKRIKSGLMAI